MSHHKFSSPGVYRIVVEGRVSPEMQDTFDTMQVQIKVADSGGGVMMLEGRVRDQAELIGILNALHEFHLSLISVRNLDTGPDPFA